MIEYGARTRTRPAPHQVVRDDLVRPRSDGPRAWLILLGDETAPRVLEAERPSRVVWSSPWMRGPDDRVVFELTPRGSDTALRFTLVAAGEPPDESLTGHIRKRVNRLVFGDLRYSYGQ